MMPSTALQGPCRSKHFPSVEANLPVEPSLCTHSQHPHISLRKMNRRLQVSGEAPWWETEANSPSEGHLIHTIREIRENGTYVVFTATNAGQKAKDGHLKQFHGACGLSPRLLAPVSARDNSLPAWQGLISKWKRCADCEQPLPIPPYFGGCDKEREETHALPWGVQQRGDLLFQSLTGTFFFFSLFLWQPLVFLLLRYFVLLQQKGQGGFWTETDLSWEWVLQLSNFCFESAFWSGSKGTSLKSDSVWIKRL